jgi:7-cyano-7-deazaguanine synthase
MKAVVLLSGGLDSTTCAYHAKEEGDDLVALTVDYGQRHDKEIAAAWGIAKRLGIPHKVLWMPLAAIGGSSLTDPLIPVGHEGVAPDIVPLTYVPARNTILLALAAGLAEVVGAGRIWIGINAVDYSNYPDCRPEFIGSMKNTLRFGTKAGLEGHAIGIATPLLLMSKAEIISHGLGLDVPYEETWSCYEGGEEPCHTCDSCRIREAAFASLHLEDPLNVRPD